MQRQQPIVFPGKAGLALKKQHRQAAVRKGLATAFRAWFGRTAGNHGGKGDWVADLFGGAKFQEVD